MKTFAYLLLTGLMPALQACAPADELPPPETRFTEGMGLIAAGDEINLTRAIEVFSACMDLTPDYAPCHAGLSLAYTNIGGVFNVLAPEESWPPAREAAEDALQLDPDLALAHFAMAQVLAGQDWDWSAADREFQRAVELAPQDLSVLDSYAWFLHLTGHDNEARMTVDQLLALDPDYEMREVEYWMFGGDVGPVREYAAAAMEAEPDRPLSYWRLANIHVREGEYAEAADRLLQQIPLMQGDEIDEVALLGHIYGRMGRIEDAEEMLARLDAHVATGRYVSPVSRAWIYAGIGDADAALSLLREGIDTHAHRSGTGMVDFLHVLEPVRSDRRFAEMLGELGLEP